MSQRALPKAQFNVRADLRSELSPRALERWRPEVNAKDEAEATISMLDVIGENWAGDGVTVKRVQAALRSIGNRDVVVHLNSPGGNFFEGLAIYNALRDHPAKVTVKILGVAASAASVIAMAGDEIQIARAGFLMIHNTWVMAAGDRHALREVADWLEPFDQVSNEIFSARTGMDLKEIAKISDRETWIGGTAAVDQGFADTFLAADEVDDKAKASPDQSSIKAIHKLHSLLAEAGVPRSERRELLSAIKGDRPSAVATGKSSAAATDVVVGVQKLLDEIRSL